MTEDRKWASFSSNNRRNPVLVTESSDEFGRHLAGFRRDLAPRGIIETTLVTKIAQLSWEIQRYEIAKSAIININVCEALKLLLQQLGFDDDEALQLAEQWFTDIEAKKKVSQILGTYKLDETAIEAQAIRASTADLDNIERILGRIELRLKQTYAMFFEFENRQVRESRRDGPVIEGQRLVQLPRNPPAAR